MSALRPLGSRTVASGFFFEKLHEDGSPDPSSSAVLWLRPQAAGDLSPKTYHVCILGERISRIFPTSQVTEACRVGICSRIAHGRRLCSDPRGTGGGQSGVRLPLGHGQCAKHSLILVRAGGTAKAAEKQLAGVRRLWEGLCCMPTSMGCPPSR